MPGLPKLLDEALDRLVGFDLTVCFAYPKDARPIFLHDGFRGRAPGEALENYLNGAYLLDPFYTACAGAVPDGLYRMKEFAPDNFFEGEYVNSWEVHPCISMESGSLAEEIGYLVRLSAGTRAIFSLMRSNGTEPFSREEFGVLQLVEPVVRQIIRLHWDGVPMADVGRDIGRRGDVMELAFERFGAALLSRREQMIVQLILRGHSAGSIASILEIAEGTVKNHRKSIYAKLGIVSQQELFSQFMRHVLA